MTSRELWRGARSGFIWLSKHFGNKQHRKNSIQLKAVLKRKVSGWESGFQALRNGHLDIWCFGGWEKVYLESSTNGMEIYNNHSLLMTSARSETQKVLQASVQWGYATWVELPLHIREMKKGTPPRLFCIVVVVRKLTRPPPSHSSKTMQECCCLKD